MRSEEKESFLFLVFLYSHSSFLIFQFLNVHILFLKRLKSCEFAENFSRKTKFSKKSEKSLKKGLPKVKRFFIIGFTSIRECRSR